MISTVLKLLSENLNLQTRFEIVFILSFLFTIAITRFFIDYLKKMGMVGIDKHKFNVYVVDSAGIPFSISLIFLMSIFSIFFKSYYLIITTVYLVSLLTSIIILPEDLSMLSKFRDECGKRVGIPRILRILLPFISTYPLVVYTWFNLKDYSTICFFKEFCIDFGVTYSLFIVPLAIFFASNGFNMLGGFNGLEISLGISMITFQTIIFLIHKKFFCAFLSLGFISVLLGILIFNIYPAEIFPGDSLSYAIGSFIATMAIFGKIEFYSLLLYWILFIEAFIKFYRRIQRGKFPECFGIPKKVGNEIIIKPPEEIGSITHITMKILKDKSNEKSIVSFIILIYLLITSLITILYLII